MENMDQKRTRAVEYLREHGIYRGDVTCRHRYEPCPHTPEPPRVDQGRSNPLPQPIEG